MLKPWLLLLPVALITACSGSDNDLSFEVRYDQGAHRLIVDLSRPFTSNEAIHLRVRRGTLGTLDCSDVLASTPAITGDSESDRLIGPDVPEELSRAFYGPEWAEGEPTPEMLAQLEAGTDSIIDACLVRDGKVVRELELDFFRAWDEGRDKGIGGKADEPGGEVRITSPQKYGERCVAELGEIPFFEKTADGEYSTYNCLDSTPVPMTVTDASGNVTMPAETASKCDKPQYIYSSCEQGPRVASRVNDQGTRWVLLCRKSVGGLASSKFNDIAMIGHNPFTGKTCFFQNALYSKTDGSKVPHPADKTKSETLWSGVHGGVGSGIECAKCHDADPWIHSPWIDGAKDDNGRPIVPKMGVDEDYPLGANDTPYSIVNLKGQSWTQPKNLVSPQASACLACHRIGSGQWLKYATRLDGTDSSFRNKTTAAYLAFDKLHWMPPDLGQITESTWNASPYGAALNFIKGCGTNPAACEFVPMPTELGPGGNGKLRNPVTNLSDLQLAQKTIDLMGGVDGSQNRCSECHSINRNTLTGWLEETRTAEATCLAETTGGTPKSEQLMSNVAIPNGEMKLFGPFEVAAGGTFKATLSGTGDGDLYVKKNAQVSSSVYDCRPYGGNSTEVCGSEQFDATGPGLFYVGVNGFGGAVVSLKVDYLAPGGSSQSPAQMVDCLRFDPSNPDSPFTPTHTGIYAAAAHLGWFEALFRAAYPVDGARSFSVEYAKFRSRVSMPKGNHPRFTQEELDVVAEWFARGLPQLDTVLPEGGGPTSCTTTISPTLLEHVSTMSTQGWSQVNKNRGLRMYGCGATTTSPNCLSNVARAANKPYGNTWETAGKLRILRELSFNTFFWMRSSADGRFIANGASTAAGAMISDLNNRTDIPAHAAYDPGFFPDNSGFVFQGTSIGAAFCQLSLLVSRPAEIFFTEPQCAAATHVNLYQHLGAALNGGDYFVINSQFTSDNGGTGQTLSDPSAGFGEFASMQLTPMVNSGSVFTDAPSISVATPYEGDTVLSPSTRLAVARLSGPDGASLGYVIHKVNATRNGTGYDITAPEVGRICVKGAKPAVSFDERYMVFHHYVEADDWQSLGFASASDAGFVALRAKGAANIFLADLTTGQVRRITTMKPGQYALYPHFRSDGWIYFLVRDSNSQKEYAVASDAVWH